MGRDRKLNGQNADEQASGILFLASDDACYITGINLPVSCGDCG